MFQVLGSLGGALVLALTSYFSLGFSSGNLEVVQKAAGGVGYGKGNHLEFNVQKRSWPEKDLVKWEIKERQITKQERKIFRAGWCARIF